MSSKTSIFKRTVPIIKSKWKKTGMNIRRSSCITTNEVNGIRQPNGAENIILFSLRLSDLNIGELSIDHGFWHFKYCESFINQNEIRPIINFPNKEKIYQSEELWPFFTSRIPGLGQPVVKEVVGTETNSLETTVLLLKHFGKQTIANPYLLESMEA